MSNRARLEEVEGGRQLLLWHCSGCDGPHGVDVVQAPGAERVWAWNGSLAAPTLSPSVVVRVRFTVERPDRVCHSFVRDGSQQFLGDCTHRLAGQTVQIPAWEEAEARG